MKLVLTFSYCYILSFALGSPQLHINTINADLPTQNTSSSTACTDVHLIVVRASTEKPGQGVIGTLANKIAGAIPGTSVEAIDYPAVLSPYNSSSFNGTETTTTRLMNYVDTCTKGRIVLLGYSQGAHVIGDVMCGGGGSLGLGPPSPPVEKKYQDKVVAMIQMGDPRHVPMKAFDVGSSMNNGIFPRPNNISCDQLAPKIQSYCDTGDPFCDMGGNVTVHLTYTQRYNQDAFNFVISKLKESNTVIQSANGTLSASTSGKTSTASKNYISGGNSYWTMLLIYAGVSALFLFFA